MALVNSLIVAYAKAIYKDGTRTFATIRVEYVEAVKQYAAANYELAVIDEALVKGFITQAEWSDTIAYIV
jgi:hypothetical protein